MKSSIVCGSLCSNVNESYIIRQLMLNVHRVGEDAELTGVIHPSGGSAVPTHASAIVSPFPEPEPGRPGRVPADFGPTRFVVCSICE